MHAVHYPRNTGMSPGPRLECTRPASHPARPPRVHTPPRRSHPPVTPVRLSGGSCMVSTPLPPVHIQQRAPDPCTCPPARRGCTVRPRPALVRMHSASSPPPTSRAPLFAGAPLRGLTLPDRRPPPRASRTLRGLRPTSPLLPVRVAPPSGMHACSTDAPPSPREPRPPSPCCGGSSPCFGSDAAGMQGARACTAGSAGERVPMGTSSHAAPRVRGPGPGGARGGVKSAGSAARPHVRGPGRGGGRGGGGAP